MSDHTSVRATHVHPARAHGPSEYVVIELLVAPFFSREPLMTRDDAQEQRATAIHLFSSLGGPFYHSDGQ